MRSRNSECTSLGDTSHSRRIHLYRRTDIEALMAAVFLRGFNRNCLPIIVQGFGEQEYQDRSKDSEQIVPSQSLPANTISKNQNGDCQEYRPETADCCSGCGTDGEEIKDCLRSHELGYPEMRSSQDVLTGSQQQELWRSAERSGADVSIQHEIPDLFGASDEDANPLLDDDCDAFGASQHWDMIFAGAVVGNEKIVNEVSVKAVCKV